VTARQSLPSLPPATPAAIDGHGRGEHLVQFYEDDAVIVAAVHGILREGLTAGAAAIVIATQPHLDEFERLLTAQGFDVAAARRRRQYVPLIARATLDELLVDGRPDARRFAEVIEPLVADLSRRHGRVVAFGEMVALLWDEGRHGAAVQLETLWNDLASRHSFELLCAYRLRPDAEAVPEMLLQVCAEHTRVVPNGRPAAAGAESSPLPEIGELERRIRVLEREVQGHKHIERVLARREQELDDFVENAPHAMHSVDPEGRILWANTAELDLLGYSAEEYVGRSIADFHVEPDRAAAILSRLRAGECLRDERASLRCKDGTVKSVSIDSNARWEDGRFQRSRCFTRDLSALRAAEEARGLLASIVDSSDDAIVSKTLEGVVTSWNAGAARLFGYSAEEMVGQPITTLVPLELRQEEGEILARLNRGERIDHFETTRVTKDGRRVDVSLTVSPVRDAAGNIIGASKSARDISERKQAQRLLAEADRRKDEFLAMLGHELRNPLAPIRNITEVLRRTAGGNSAQQEMCTVLDRQVQHMTKLLDDLLDVSRIRQGKIRLVREPVDVLTVVARAVETTRPLIDARGHTLRLELPSEAVRVLGDVTRLVQMLGNLLNNAARYTPEGGEITISAVSRGSMIELHVIDTGAGMPAEMLPVVFDLFVQAERTMDRSQGGLGIGLTLVRTIAQLHGGSVLALSDGPGQGSEFVVSLPLLRSGRETSGLEVAVAPEGRASARRRVLVVDDNRDASDSLALLLRLGGHQVFIAESGHAALETELAQQPDLILLDIGLPDLDGYEVARRLRAAGCSAILAALTGYGQPEDRERALEAGFDEHLVKPVDPRALERLLD